MHYVFFRVLTHMPAGPWNVFDELTDAPMQYDKAAADALIACMVTRHEGAQFAAVPCDRVSFTLPTA